jgi:hypothetical protein
LIFLSSSPFSTADYINSITAFAALFTAASTLITIREIRRQREHSYHPDINVANIEFYLYRYDKDEEDEEELDTLLIHYSKERLGDDVQKSGYNELTIDINNIGLAVAKQVHWHWEMDMIEVYRSIKGTDDGFMEWIIKDGDLFVTVQKLNVDWIYVLNEENYGGYFNFILPYHIENRSNKIKIPSYFIDLYWLYKSKEMLDGYQQNDKEFPPLELHIAYTNIHGKELQKVFLLYLQYSFIGNPLRDTSELAKFRVEIFEAA